MKLTSLSISISSCQGSQPADLGKPGHVDCPKSGDLRVSRLLGLWPGEAGALRVRQPREAAGPGIRKPWDPWPQDNLHSRPATELQTLDVHPRDPRLHSRKPRSPEVSGSNWSSPVFWYLCVELGP